MRRRLSIALAAAAFAAAPARADDDLSAEGSFVIRNCRLEAGDGSAVDDAVVVVRDGRVEAAGLAASVKAPAGLPVLDGGGGTVFPGFVLAASRLGTPFPSGAAEKSTPSETAGDEVDPSHRAFREAARAGVALACIVPGPGAPAGEGVPVRPAAAGSEAFRVAGGRVLRVDVDASTAWAKALEGAFEAARKEIEQEEKSEKEREAWRAAAAEFEAKKAAIEKEYEATRKKHEEEKAKAEKEGKPVPSTPVKPDPGKAPPEPKAFEPDAKTAIVRDALRRKAPVVVFAGGASDAERALDLLARWKLRLAFRVSGDAWKVARRIAAEGATVLVEAEITTAPASSERLVPAAVFEAAGAPVVLLPRDETRRGLRAFREEAGILVRCGLPRRAAVRGLALEGAKVLGLDETCGTVAPGRSADLLLFDGDPLEPASRLRAAWSAGKRVPPGPAGEEGP